MSKGMSKTRESKVESVDKLYNLHKATAEAMEFSNEDPEVSPWRKLAPIPFSRETDKLEFYTDVLFFMRKLRNTHEGIVAMDRQDKERRGSTSLAHRRASHHGIKSYIGINICTNVIKNHKLILIKNMITISLKVIVSLLL